MLHFCSMQQWFETWFDTEYYHLLYANRDDREAQLFMDQLMNRLSLKPGAKLLDNACGKGRHAKYLAQKEYQVTGLDLSPNSIQSAKQFETDHLKFEVHDMRDIYISNTFDAVLNLFTSFGYFENDVEDKKILNAIYQELRDDGYFVLDFFNAYQVEKMINSGLHLFDKMLKGIRFEITKKIEDGHVIKHIKVTDGELVNQYEERVKLWTKEMLEKLITQANFSIIDIFGEYDLTPYRNDSSRCIFICKKHI